MSLTQHLPDLMPPTAGLRELAEQTAESARSAHPVRPPATAERSDLATVGAIVGQLVADAVDPAPPYPALLGAIRCEGLSPAAADTAAAAYPSHRTTAGRAAFARPTPAGWWSLPAVPEADGIEPEPVVEDVLWRHQHAAWRTGGRGTIAPPSRADVADQHALALLESVYRGGDLGALVQMAKTGSPLVSDEIAADVANVAEAARRPVEQARSLASSSDHDLTRLGYAAPTFVPQWAEGDLAIGPDRRDGGYTLLDVKTSLRAHRVDQVQEWLAQLAAYALLDPGNRWQIHRLGLLLPRQGLLVGWSAEDVLARCGLADQPRRERWRDRALTAARHDGAAISRDGRC